MTVQAEEPATEVVKPVTLRVVYPDKPEIPATVSARPDLTWHPVDEAVRILRAGSLPTVKGPYKVNEDKVTENSRRLLRPGDVFEVDP